MHENNDHLLAGGWLVILNSPDMLLLNPTISNSNPHVYRVACFSQTLVFSYFSVLICVINMAC